MSDIVFKDCEYRYVEEDGILCCKNKQGIETDLSCDNCTGNIHLNCDNYNAKKDLCLKWFETEVSKNYKDCWCYQYTDDAGKHKIRRKDIGELEKIVKSKGLLWRKF